MVGSRKTVNLVELVRQRKLNETNSRNVSKKNVRRSRVTHNRSSRSRRVQRRRRQATQRYKRPRRSRRSRPAQRLNRSIRSRRRRQPRPRHPRSSADLQMNTEPTTQFGQLENSQSNFSVHGSSNALPQSLSANVLSTFELRIGDGIDTEDLIILLRRLFHEFENWLNPQNSNAQQNHRITNNHATGVNVRHHPIQINFEGTPIMRITCDERGMISTIRELSPNFQLHMIDQRASGDGLLVDRGRFVWLNIVASLENESNNSQHQLQNDVEMANVRISEEDQDMDNTQVKQEEEVEMANALVTEEEVDMDDVQIIEEDEMADALLAEEEVDMDNTLLDVEIEVANIIIGALQINDTVAQNDQPEENSNAN